MKRLLDVHKDRELADYLGVAPNTISNWRARGSVPFEMCAKVAEREHASVDWLVTGRGHPGGVQVTDGSLELARRLRGVMEAMGSDPEHLADVTGVDNQSMHDVLAGAVAPSVDVLRRIKEGWALNAEWLLSGVGPIYQPGCAPPGHEVDAGVPPMYQGHAHTGGDRPVAIPRYGIELAAGGGATVIEEAAIGHLYFRADYLAKHNIPPEMAGIATLRGRSMEKLLYDGDSVLFNRGMTRIVSGAAYVVRLGDELVCKYLSHQGDQIVVSSENSDMFPPYTVPVSDFESGAAAVVGLVCVSSHDWMQGLVL